MHGHAESVLAPIQENQRGADAKTGIEEPNQQRRPRGFARRTEGAMDMSSVPTSSRVFALTSLLAANSAYDW